MKNRSQTANVWWQYEWLDWCLKLETDSITENEHQFIVLFLYFLRVYIPDACCRPDLVVMTEPIFHTVITNPECGRQLPDTAAGSKPPPDPGKPRVSLLQRPCQYLSWWVAHFGLFSYPFRRRFLFYLKVIWKVFNKCPNFVFNRRNQPVDSCVKTSIVLQLMNIPSWFHLNVYFIHMILRWFSYNFIGCDISCRM